MGGGLYGVGGSSASGGRTFIGSPIRARSGRAHQDDRHLTERLRAHGACE